MFFIISAALVPFTFGQLKNVFENRTTFERLKNGRLCLDVLSGRMRLIRVDIHEGDYEGEKDEKSEKSGSEFG